MTYTNDWALAQVKIDGRWIDYARGTYAQSVRFVDSKPYGNARVVFWIGKTEIYPVPVRLVDTSEWADYEIPTQPYSVTGVTDGESWEMTYDTLEEAVHSADWFNSTILGTEYQTSWGLDANETPARVTRYGKES